MAGEAEGVYAAMGEMKPDSSSANVSLTGVKTGARSDDDEAERLSPRDSHPHPWSFPLPPSFAPPSSSYAVLS